MSQVFDCPKCGAPQDFEPKPGQKTLECLFCHETVTIPEDLRIPEPQAEYYAPPIQPPKSLSTCMISAIVGAGIIVLTVVAFIIFSAPSKTTTDESVTDYTSLDDSRGTATVEARATDRALGTLLLLVQSWPVTFSDNFTDNNHGWSTGDIRDSYLNGNRSISHGIYRWNVTSLQSVLYLSCPDKPDLSDFYVSVDMNLVSMPEDVDADAGLILRYNDADQTWYYFSVSDYGEYYFGWYDGQDWYNLISSTHSDAIRIDAINHLAVGVQGSQFIFVINGQMVDHFVDEHLASGTLGLAVNLPGENEKAEVEFTNFSVAYNTPAQ
jgi:hypothetical protein